MYKHYFNPDGKNFNFENRHEFKSLPKHLQKCRYILEVRKDLGDQPNGAESYFNNIVLGLFLKEEGCLKPDSDDCKRMEKSLLMEKYGDMYIEIYETIDAMSLKVLIAFIKDCERLYFDNYNGSFPDHKSEGYDFSKK